MGKHLLIFCAWLALAGFTAAQAPPDRLPDSVVPRPPAAQPKELPPLPPLPVEPGTAEPAPVAFAAPSVPGEIVWFRSEFMFWLLPPSHVGPIVTTGDPSNPCAGIINQPDTKVLYGDHNYSNANTSGLRFTAGAWLDSQHLWGIEANYFSVFRESHQFVASVYDPPPAGANNGTPPPPQPGLYLSAFNLNCNLEDSLVIADSVSQFGGTVRIKTDVRVQGGEFNTFFNVYRGPAFEWNLLTGMRYLQIREDFALTAQSRDLVLDQQITLADRFRTDNQFFGGQFGTRLRFRYGRFMTDVVGKLALGVTEQTRYINGESSSSGADATITGTFPSGFYAQPSNIGVWNRNTFGVIPALELKMGYQITPRWFLTVGYDIFYLNQAARVGTLIDRNLNLSQNPLFGANLTPTPVVGPVRSNESMQFVVQGLSLGMEIRY